MRGVSTTAEEAQRQLIVIGLIAGHCANKPFIPVPASDDNVLPYSAVENLCLFPHGGNHAQKLKSRLVAVMLRIVRNTCERTPVHDEEGELLGAAAYHLRRCGLFPFR